MTGSEGGMSVEKQFSVSAEKTCNTENKCNTENLMSYAWAALR